MRISPFYEYYGGHLGFLQNITCYTCKKKWNPIFFLPLLYSEPESVAKSILTSKKSEPCFYDKWAYTTTVRACDLKSTYPASVCRFVHVQRIQCHDATEDNEPHGARLTSTVLVAPTSILLQPSDVRRRVTKHKLDAEQSPALARPAAPLAASMQRRPCTKTNKIWLPSQRALMDRKSWFQIYYLQP